MDSIRLIKWENGYHIYAKVGDDDVVDMHGNQKWSTTKEAEEAAKWYMRSLTQL